MENNDQLVEQVVQYGVLYYIIPDGLEGVSEDDLKQINALNNYSVIDLVGKLKDRNIDNSTNLYPLFEAMVDDENVFCTTEYITEFLVEVVAEVLDIDEIDYEEAIMDFLDENEDNITINDFVRLAIKIIKEGE